MRPNDTKHTARVAYGQLCECSWVGQPEPELEPDQIFLEKPENVCRSPIQIMGPNTIASFAWWVNTLFVCFYVTNLLHYLTYYLNLQPYLDRPTNYTLIPLYNECLLIFDNTKIVEAFRLYHEIPISVCEWCVCVCVCVCAHINESSTLT